MPRSSSKVHAHLVRHNRVRRPPVIPAPEPLTDIQLPFTIDGTIVSTAGILLFMDTVEIEGSNISVLCTKDIRF
jgi:hypothetical protein